jgi:hypothetical protein
MIESIQKYGMSEVKFSVLAMDDRTFDYLISLKIPNVQLTRLCDFVDERFQELISSRPFRELCWTAASCFTRSIYRSDSESDFIIYVDSDCYFFTDISKLIYNWNEGSNIFIHEHRYSPLRIEWEKTSGVFNVGVVGFRQGSTEALACLDRWRLQVLNSCELKPDEGLCGDQGYLNEWPGLYPGLQIMNGAGEGAAPWNVEPLQARLDEKQVLIEGQELVFYHFHALEPGINRKLRILISSLALGYSIPSSIRRFVYKPYLRHLLRINRVLLNSGHTINEIGLKELGVKEITQSASSNQHVIQLIR